MRAGGASLALAAFAMAALVLALAGAGVGARSAPTGGAETEAVVLLASPPLAYTPGRAAALAGEQRAFRRALARTLPEARVRWRYRIVANGFAVVLPRNRLPALRRLPGVRDVVLGGRYGPALGRPRAREAAHALPGRALQSGGEGMKIGIIDTGIDPRHPFFDPAGYTPPPGFPKGQRRFTSAKVIVARAFPPPGARAPGARLAFDGGESAHGTHVAGIAAGNAGTPAGGGRLLSGVAPRAYLGNYKALVRTDSGLSPNGNAPELVAAIEAAVRDGMDVINLSLGQPEVEPTRDAVALALDAAAAAGVVPVVAAGNDYGDAGAGSVSSPGTSAQALTVGAADPQARAAPARAGFSSVGPTPLSVRLKPDVVAPGVGILSSVPGGWAALSGTSMAAPHVAGAAALLLQRHPDWTPGDVKAALIGSGRADEQDAGAPRGPSSVGGGLVNLAAADHPLLLADPPSLSFGFLRRGAAAPAAVALRDAGGGAGAWQASVETVAAPAGAAVALAQSEVSVPGTLALEARVAPDAAEGEIAGYLVLRRGADARRVPFWGRVAAPALGRHRALPLPGPGVYRGTTAGRPALVSRYRYPEDPRGMGVAALLRGPEAVYRLVLRRPVANFGVVVTARARGVRVEPRVTAGLDENRLTGFAGLPVAENPYLEGFRDPLPAAGALLPGPGEYAVVFDSPTGSGAGRFSFRLWVDDVTPPLLRLRTRTLPRGARWLLVRASDAGAGVFPGSIRAAVDGRPVPASFRAGLVRVRVAGLAPGRHRLRLRVSDYQEPKNTENVARVLPNTRVLTATFAIR